MCWLTIAEAAAYLRYSVPTMRRLVRLKKIKSSKPSGKILIAQEWLDEFAGIKSQPKPAHPKPVKASADPLCKLQVITQ